MEEINSKEEQIILLKRTVQELEGEVEEKVGMVEEMEAIVEGLKGHAKRLEEALHAATSEI